MRKSSKTLKQRRIELKSKESAIWEELNNTSDKIEKRISVNLKKVGIVVAGTAVGLVVYKGMTGGFKKSEKKLTSKAKKRVNEVTSQVVFQALKKLLPVLIEKFRSNQDENKE